MFAILLILTWRLKKTGQQNKGALVLKWMGWGTCCALVLRVQAEISSRACLLVFCFLFFFATKLLNVVLTCTFMPWLLNSLDLPRYVWFRMMTPRLVSMVDYGFDQWSVVSFVIKKLFVYLFMVKQWSILSNSAALSNSTASLTIPISLLLKFIPASLIVPHCGSDIRGSAIGCKEF